MGPAGLSAWVENMKNAHLYFHIGNVIADPSGDKWIVTNVNDTNISVVSFDHSNYRTTQELNDHEDERECECCEHDGLPESDCEKCRGTGRCKLHITGWRHSKILAPTVKDFILNGVRKQFNIW